MAFDLAFELTLPKNDGRFSDARNARTQLSDNGRGSGGMHGEYKIPGGKLVVVDLNVIDARLADVRVSGDFFIEPDSALDAIDAALDGMRADASLEALTAAIEASLDAEVSLYGITSSGVATAVRRAIEGAAP